MENLQENLQMEILVKWTNEVKIVIKKIVKK